MIGDWELPSVCHKTTPKARKEHRCCECGQVIPKGDQYERVDGVWDGSWDCFKTCFRCVLYRDEHGRDEDGSFGFGELEESLAHVSFEILDEWKKGFESSQ